MWQFLKMLDADIYSENPAPSTTDSEPRLQPLNENAAKDYGAPGNWEGHGASKSLSLRQQ